MPQGPTKEETALLIECWNKKMYVRDIADEFAKQLNKYVSPDALKCRARKLANQGILEKRPKGWNRKDARKK